VKVTYIYVLLCGIVHGSIACQRAARMALYASRACKCVCTGIAVHQECYGIPTVPEYSWVCDYCTEKARDPSIASVRVDCVTSETMHTFSFPLAQRCEACGMEGGALKSRGGGGVVHVQCVLGNPLLGFKDQKRYRDVHTQEPQVLGSMVRGCSSCA
jgi:hypothetical protein